MVQFLQQNPQIPRTDVSIDDELLCREAIVSGETILLVEPDPDRQWKLTRYLTKIGQRVVATASSAGAVAFLRQYRVNLVLIAENLPKAEGRYLASAIRNAYPGLPISILDGESISVELDHLRSKPLWPSPRDGVTDTSLRAA
jgi:CheY-like chemotaxis protein